MIGIYKITSPTNRVYIGQSVDIENRFKQYKNLTNCKTQRKLYRSFLKYNPKNHIFEIIKECEIENLNKEERYYQDYYNVLKNGLNCKLTETEDKSAIISKKTCINISNSLKGIKKSEEHKRKISEGKKEYYKHNLHKNIGTKMSKESIQKRLDSMPKHFGGKKVICILSGKIWQNASVCSIENNINYSTLRFALQGRTKNKNINFKYLEI